MNNGNALALRSQETAIAPETGRAFEPRNFDEAMRLAEIVVKSGMFGVTNAADAFVRMSTGVALGLSAVQSLRGIFVIKGRAGISADLMMALARQSPDCEYFRMVESTPTKATFVAKRRSDTKPTTLSFTVEDAQRAGLTNNDNYRKYPAQMLRARCIAGLTRLMFPEKLHGLYTPDELKAGEVSDEEPLTVEVEQPKQETPAPAPSEPKAVSQEDVEADILADDARRAFEAATTMADVEAASAIARKLDAGRKRALVPVRNAALARVNGETQ